MYSLDCSFFSETFGSIDELINYVTISGSDPNYEITKNGKPTGEMVIDLMMF